MRCVCCDASLTDLEATRQSKTTHEYLDMCDSCFKEVQEDFIDIEINEEQQELDSEMETYHEL